MKFDMYIKSIKNMQFNGYIFKICSKLCPYLNKAQLIKKVM